MRISDWSSDVCSSDLAEEHTIMRFEEARGKDTPNPSVRKSETGAIDRVELYGPADRRTFSADDAIAWLSNPVTGSRSEERRVGKECVSTGSSRWSPSY